VCPLNSDPQRLLERVDQLGEIGAPDFSDVAPAPGGDGVVADQPGGFRAAAVLAEAQMDVALGNQFKDVLQPLFG
jgi:hypothetical protein